MDDVKGLIARLEGAASDVWHEESEYADAVEVALLRDAAAALSRLADAEERATKADMALREIKALKPTPIGNTGFSVGPLALLNAAQRIARDATKRKRTIKRPQDG